jgi:biopolymer transport protein ExbD
MTIFSPVPRKRGRIEIIPLIDIMFFLLAAFMIVSIHKIKVKSLKVSLPTDVPVSQLEPKEDFVSVSINPQGQVQIDKDLITDPSTLLPKLQAIYARNKDQKFLISADKDSRNGDVIAVLAKLRTAGFQRVAFNLKGGGATPPAPAPSNATGSSAPPATPPVPSQPSVAPSVPVPLAPAVATPTELAAPSSSSAAPSPPPTPPKP